MVGNPFGWHIETAIVGGVHSAQIQKTVVVDGELMRIACMKPIAVNETNIATMISMCMLLDQMESTNKRIFDMILNLNYIMEHDVMNFPYDKGDLVTLESDSNCEPAFGQEIF